MHLHLRHVLVGKRQPVRHGCRQLRVERVAAIGFGVVICEGWPTMGTDFGGVKFIKTREDCGKVADVKELVAKLRNEAKVI